MMNSSREGQERHPVAGAVLLILAQASSAGASFLLESVARLYITVMVPGATASWAIAAAAAASTAPRIIIQGPAGRRADFGRKDHTLVISAIIKAISLIALTLSLLIWPLNVAVISGFMVVSVFVSFSIGQFFNATRAAFTQAFTPAGSRPEVASWSMFALSSMGIIAAAMVPLIFEHAGAVGVLVSASVLEISTILVTLRFLRKDFPHYHHRASSLHVNSQTSRPSHRLDLASQHDAVKLLFMLASIYGLLAGATSQALPLYVLRTRSIEIAQFGLVTGAFAVGSLIGAVVCARLVHRHGATSVLNTSLLVCGGLYVLFSLGPNTLTLTLVMLLTGITVGVFGASQGPILQQYIDHAKMGRAYSRLVQVSGIFTLLGTILAALTTAISGAVGHGNVAPDIYAWVIACSGLLAFTTPLLLMARRMIRNARSSQV